METRFQYDLTDKQLLFHVRQRVTTAQKLEFKAVGLMDPSTGTVSYRAALKQYAALGGTEVKGTASKPFRLGVGVAVASTAGGAAPKRAAGRGSPAAAVQAGGGAAAAAPAPLLTLSAEKKLALLEGGSGSGGGGGGGGSGSGSSATTLTLRAVADVDLTERRLASRRGLVKVSHSMPRFTGRQDLKLSAGATIDWAPESRGQPKPALFLQLRENNWAATLREGRATLTYDL